MASIHKIEKTTVIGMAPVRYNKLLVALAALLIVVVSFIPRPYGEHAESAPAQRLGERSISLTLGMQTSPVSALLMAAKDKGLFERAGLSVELKGFTAGKFALQAFLGGSLDAVVSGEVPVLLAFLQGHRLNVVAQVVETSSNQIRIVARRDGTEDSAGRFFLAKKRSLATSFGGGPEYFTYKALREIGVSSAQVTIVSQRPEDMPAALASGSVDAISVFDPFAFMAEQQLGADAVVFHAVPSYSETYLLSLSPELLDARPEAARRFLAVLFEASSFIEAHPNEAKDIVARYTRLDRLTLDAVWPGFVFKPVLTRALLDTWHDEYAWQQEMGRLPDGHKQPDFGALLKADILKALHPEQVRL